MTDAKRYKWSTYETWEYFNKRMAEDYEKQKLKWMGEIIDHTKYELNKLSNQLNQLKMQQTLGQQVMRVSFNPSKDVRVDEIKQLYADLYDRIHSIQFETDKLMNDEVVNLLDRSKDELELSCMLATKALTTTVVV